MQHCATRYYSLQLGICHSFLHSSPPLHSSLRSINYIYQATLHTTSCRAFQSSFIHSRMRLSPSTSVPLSRGTLVTQLTTLEPGTSALRLGGIIDFTSLCVL